jgi:hypothetical protein
VREVDVAVVDSRARVGIHVGYPARHQGHL